MIEAKIDKAKIRLTAFGDSLQLVAETMLMVRKLYEALGEADQAQAEEFKLMIIAGVTDPDTPL